MDSATKDGTVGTGLNQSDQIDMEVIVEKSHKEESKDAIQNTIDMNPTFPVQKYSSTTVNPDGNIQGDSFNSTSFVDINPNLSSQKLSSMIKENKTDSGTYQSMVSRNIKFNDLYQSFFEKNEEKIHALLSKIFKEYFNLKIHNGMVCIQYLEICMDKVKSLLMYGVQNISHSSEEEFMLSKRTEQWKSLINLLENKFFCIISNAEDFSETTFLVTPEHKGQVEAEIKGFINNLEYEVAISCNLIQYVITLGDFSDILPSNSEETQFDKPFYNMQMNKCILEKMKDKLKTFTSRSYLLEENISKSSLKEILSEIESVYQIRGNIFHQDPSTDPPLVLEVTPNICLTSISAMEPLGCLVDSLIKFGWKPLFKRTNIMLQKGNMKLREILSWDCTINRCFYAEVPDLENAADKINWKPILEDCLRVVYQHHVPATTVGIDLSTLSVENLERFCSDFVATMKTLKEISESSFKRCVVLIVENAQKHTVVDRIVNTHFMNSSESTDNSTTKTESSQEEKDTELTTFPETTKTYQQIPLQLIQFLNYSENPENLNQAINNFDINIKQINAGIELKMDCEDFECLFFFHDIKSSVPDIIQQLDNKDENYYYFFIPNYSAKYLKNKLSEIKRDLHVARLELHYSITKTVIELCIVRHNQTYPNVRCIWTEKDHAILFQSFDWEQIQIAKYSFGKMLGLFVQEISDVNKFNEIEILNRRPVDADFMNKPEPKNMTFNSKAMDHSSVYITDIQFICCFKCPKGLIVKVYSDDILSLDVEAIVNAANNDLLHTGGVAKVIVDAAGDEVNQEGKEYLKGCKNNICPDGEVVITSAGKLRYKNIIHAVCPNYIVSRMDKNYCRNKIAQAVYNALSEAGLYDIKTLALPAISSGTSIFAVPRDVCLKGYCQGVAKFDNMYKIAVTKEVHFVDIRKDMIEDIQNYFKTTFELLSEKPYECNRIQQGKQQEVLLPEERTSNVDFPSGISKNWRQQNNTQKKCLIRFMVMGNCGHIFCTKCTETSGECPICRKIYIIVTGDQPRGKMSYLKTKYSLEGYKNCKAFQITYEMAHRERKFMRFAYLPANGEGETILKMLQLAFKLKMIFTIEESKSTSYRNELTWNISHKTSILGGSTGLGYPDAGYLDRVTDELAAKGIKPDTVVNTILVETIYIS